MYLPLFHFFLLKILAHYPLGNTAAAAAVVRGPMLQVVLEAGFLPWIFGINQWRPCGNKAGIYIVINVYHAYTRSVRSLSKDLVRWILIETRAGIIRRATPTATPRADQRETTAVSGCWLVWFGWLRPGRYCCHKRRTRELTACWMDPT